MIPGLYILIPARNEEKNIAKVINNYKRYGKVIVINDFSSDKTYQIAKKNCLLVLNNKKKIGYDFSLRKGINYITRMKSSKYILTLDGDNQHPSINLYKIIKYMKKYDLIIFNREKFQRVSEYIVHLISNFLYKIKDPLSGMKFYNINILKDRKSLIKNIDYVGMFFFKLCSKNKILNIKIKTKNKIKSSFGTGLKANIKIIRAFFNCLI